MQILYATQLKKIKSLLVGYHELWKLMETQELPGIVGVKKNSKLELVEKTDMCVSIC